MDKASFVWHQNWFSASYEMRDISTVKLYTLLLLIVDSFAESVHIEFELVADFSFFLCSFEFES